MGIFDGNQIWTCDVENIDMPQEVPTLEVPTITATTPQTPVTVEFLTSAEQPRAELPWYRIPDQRRASHSRRSLEPAVHSATNRSNQGADYSNDASYDDTYGRGAIHRPLSP